MKVFKNISKRSLYLGTGFVALIILIGVGFSVSGYGLTSIIDADANESGAYLIDPASVEINKADSYEFTSYTKSSTGSIKVKSNWQVEREHNKGYIEEGPNDIYLESCINSDTCNIHVGIQTGDLNVVAENEGKKASALLTVKDELSEKDPYLDYLPDWAKDSIYLLRDRGLMKGYDDGNFGSIDNVTRGQFVLLEYRILKMSNTDLASPTESCDIYDDVTSEHYAYEAVCTAYYENWFTDVDLYNNDKDFHPNDPLLRHEAAMILGNSLLTNMWDNIYAPLTFKGNDPNLINLTTLKYEDILDGLKGRNPSYFHTIAIVTHFGLMKGSMVNVDGDYVERFYPYKSINRAETAVIFARFIKDFDL